MPPSLSSRLNAESNPFASRLLDHWNVGSILTLAAGFPFKVVSGVDNSRTAFGADRPNLTGDPRFSVSRPRAKIVRYFDGAAFPTFGSDWAALEFTDESGNGIGKGLCLQLKAGNSHLETRRDGREVFQIKKERWVETWTHQPYPVMLVIGTFADDEDERRRWKERREFADVRWMEITSVLEREKAKGPVKSIEFTGARLDMSSVLEWRRRIVGS